MANEKSGRKISMLPNWATYGIAALIAIAIGYLIVSALTGGDDKTAATDDQGVSLFGGVSGLTKNAKGELANSTHTATKIGDKYMLIANTPATPAPTTGNETGTPDQGEPDTGAGTDTGADTGTPDQGEPDTGAGDSGKAEDTVIKTSTFKDWVNGELNIKDTDIADFTVFSSKAAAQEFVDGYKWNKKHNDFSWNYEEFGYYVADEYGESDPAPAAFFTSTTAYFVVISGNGLTPDYYQLDSDVDTEFKLIEKKGDEKSVYAVDQLETEA